MTLLLLLACSRAPTVVVVGGGPAGMSAAVEATGGTKVVLLEARGELGGSMTLGDAVTAVPSAATLARIDAAEGHNPARARFVQEVRPQVIEWLGTLGVRWSPVPNRLDDQSELWAPEGRGSRITAALIGEMERRGVELRLGQRVEGLARGARWTVRVAGGDPVEADAVVIATGGFAGDVERTRRALGLGPEVPLLRGGATWADGNGIDLAVAAGGHEHLPGAAVLYAHGVPDPRDPTRALMLVDATRAWPVDTTGAPLPEAQSPRGDSGLALLRRPGSVGWAVLDRPALRDVKLWDPDVGRGTAVKPVAQAHGLQGDSLEELAARIGVPVEALRAGLGDGPATPERPLHPSDRYAALPLRITTAKSLTGVEVDLDGRVLDAAGAPIPGLYAAGEAAGFAHPWEVEHIDSTMVSGAVLTGRAAGRAVRADLGLAR